jgi:hypothetical protein
MAIVLIAPLCVAAFILFQKTAPFHLCLKFSPDDFRGMDSTTETGENNH